MRFSVSNDTTAKKVIVLTKKETNLPSEMLIIAANMRKDISPFSPRCVKIFSMRPVARLLAATGSIGGRKW